MKNCIRAIVCLLPLAALPLFVTADEAKKDDGHKHVLPTKAVAVLVPSKDSTVHGKITFTQTEAGVEVAGEVTGLTPGKHGFHIHEFGDVSSPDGMAAGGHFNPAGKPHGHPGAAERHAGDLGNIEADKDGKATVKVLDKDLHIHFILGRAVVVHAKEDDGSQPVGNAGPRVAVGVIGVAKP